MTLVACTSDEEVSANEQPQQQMTEQLQTVQEVLAEVGDNLAQIDFQQLAPLADALQESNTWAARGQKDGDGEQQGKLKFLEKFKSLLQQLLDGKKGVKWSVANAEETLQLTVSALFELEGIGLQESTEGNQRTYECELKVTTKQDTVYTIKTKVMKNLGGKLSQLSMEGLRVLQVYKEDKMILGLEADRLLTFGNSYVHSGKIHTQKADIELAVKLTEEHTLVRSIRVAKDNNAILSMDMSTDRDFDWKTILQTGLRYKTHVDANLMDKIVIKTDVADALQFYKEGLALAALSLTGTTEENCKKLTDSFNENVNIQLLMADAVMGSVLVTPTKSNKQSDRYTPAIVAVTSISNYQPLTIEKTLGLMGFSFQDIINMLMGKTKEDGNEEEEYEDGEN